MGSSLIKPPLSLSVLQITWKTLNPKNHRPIKDTEHHNQSQPFDPLSKPPSQHLDWIEKKKRPLGLVSSHWRFRAPLTCPSREFIEEGFLSLSRSLSHLEILRRLQSRAPSPSLSPPLLLLALSLSLYGLSNGGFLGLGFPCLLPFPPPRELPLYPQSPSIPIGFYSKFVADQAIAHSDRHI